jgi:hypothetical protein
MSDFVVLVVVFIVFWALAVGADSAARWISGR